MTILAGAMGLAGCTGQLTDYSGTYVRAADDDVYALADTIYLKKLTDDPGAEYAFERKVYAAYKDGQTKSDTTILNGYANYDPSRDVLAVERSEQEWVIDTKRGILRSGINEYRLLR